MSYFRLIKINEYPAACHIPHGSINIPDEFRNDFVISDQELKNETLRLADLYAESIYKNLFNKFGGIISDISRIIVDLERFPNKEKEIMSKFGMGAIYTKNESGKIIKKINKERENFLMNKIYEPYYIAFADLISYSLSKFGKCLILDCHTFPSQPRAYDLDKNTERPDICIGTDSFHTPDYLKQLFIRNFKNNDFIVKHDSPFSGTVVPAAYYHSNNRVHSIMIEINRKLYMDENKFIETENFKFISEKICEIIMNTSVSFLNK